jgi:hypothetical protein
MKPNRELVARSVAVTVMVVCLISAASLALCQAQRGEAERSDRLGSDEHALSEESGYYIPRSPQQERDRALHEFASQWVPHFLYLSRTRMFAPASLNDIAGIARTQGRITGLATTPGADAVVLLFTEEEECRAVLSYLSAPHRRVVARATELGADTWLHGPAFLSPHKRWLLAMGAPGRREAVAHWRTELSEAAFGESGSVSGDLWAIDCTGMTPPRLLLSCANLLSCSWAPGGSRAACSVVRGAEGDPEVVLLDLESGAVGRIAAGAAYAAWSPDAETIRIYSEKGQEGTTTLYETSSGSTRSVARQWAWRVSPEAVWSADGRTCGYPETRDGREGLRVAKSSGRSHLWPLSARPKQVVGWSGRGELLAYVGGDNRLGFWTGLVSDDEYEQLMAAYPPTPAGLDRSLRIQSPRDGIAPQTKESPVEVSSSGLAMFGWAATAEGPCFVFAEESASGQKVRALRFRRMSLEDLGLSLQANLHTQLIEQLGVENMEAVAQALIGYAKEHNGALPSHESGSELERELAPYLDYVGRLHDPNEPGRVAVRLLEPGITVGDLRAGRGRSADSAIGLAQLEAAGVRVTVITSSEYAWPDDEFAYEVVVERE